MAGPQARAFTAHLHRLNAPDARRLHPLLPYPEAYMGTFKTHGRLPGRGSGCMVRLGSGT